tara:strand:+ start:11395 stop:16623 length:5229 start_codon:yes stop_codon:yes gene_type:complete
MNIQELLESRLRSYDPQLDLSEGSELQNKVISPIVDAFGADGLTTDTRDFLLQKFDEAFPSSPVSTGDAISDILITACEIFLNAYRRELNSLSYASSIANIDTMSDSDADALAANWFVGRSSGSKSVGIVNVVVDRTFPIAIDPSVSFFTSEGLVFKPLYIRTISEQELISAQIATNQFSFEVYVTSSFVGAEYNIGENQIVTSSGINNVISVSNALSFTGGASRDTTETLLRVKVPNSISERSLVTSRGIIAQLSNSIRNVRKYQVIGLDDPEMVRDSVSKVSYSGSLGFGYGYSLGHLVIISVPDISTLTAGVVLQCRNQNSFINLTIQEVISSSPTSIFLDGTSSVICLVDKELGDFAFSFVALSKNTSILGDETLDSSVHLGGKTDVYISPEVTQSVVTDLDRSLSQEGIIIGRGVETLTGNRVQLNSPSQIPTEFSVLTYNNEDHYIIDIESEVPLVVRVASNPNPTNAQHKWKIVSKVQFLLGSGYETVAPIASQSLVVTGFRQTTTISIDVGEDLNPFRIGDEIIVDDKFTFVLSNVEGQTLTTQSFIEETFIRSSALVRRRLARCPQPISFINSINRGDDRIPRSKCLGVFVNDLSPNVEAIESGTGFISPSYKRPLKEFKQRYNALNSPISLVENANTGYELFTFNEEISHPQNTSFRNHRTPFSLGYRVPRTDSCVLLSVNANAAYTVATKTITDADMTEVEFFNEMFMADTRNIFIAQGDILSNERFVSFPLEGTEEGDILEISEGLNAGKYVIASVINAVVPIVKPDSRYVPSVSVSDRLFVRSTVSNDSQHSDTYMSSEDATASYARPVYRKVSIVKIYGQFPQREYSYLDEFLSFGNSPLDGTGTFFFPISNTALSSMLADPEELLDQTYLLNHINSRLLDIEDSPSDCTFELTIKDIQNLIEYIRQSRGVSYSVYKRATSDASVRVFDGEVFLKSPKQSFIPLTQVLNTVELDNSQSSYLIPSMSILEKGINTFVPSSGQKSYILASPIEEWPEIGQLATIRNDYTVSEFHTYNSSSAAEFDLLLDSGISIADNHLISAPVDLHLHEEIFSSYSMQDVINSFRLVYVPYTADNLDTTEVQSYDEGGTLRTATFKTSTTLLTEFEQYLDYKNSYGKTLREVISAYPVYLTLENIESIITSLDTTQPITLEDSNQNTTSVTILAHSIEHFYSLTLSKLSSVPLLPLCSCVSGSQDIQLHNFNDTFEPISTGSIAVITQRGQRLIRSVSSYDQQLGVVSLDSPLTLSDDSVITKGVMYLNTSTGFGHLGTGTRTRYSNNRVVFTESEGASFSQTTNTVLLDSYVGKRITLYSVTYNYLETEHMYGNADSSNQSNDPTTLEELREDVFSPVRTVIGTLTISDIENTVESDVTFGTRSIVEQKVTFQDNDEVLALATDLDLGDFVRVGFIITEPDAPSSEGSFSLSTVRFYKKVPTAYPITGYDVSGGSSLLISSLEENIYPDVETSSFFKYSSFEVGQVSYSILTGYSSNNPYNLSSASYIKASDETAIKVQDLNCVQRVSNSTVRATDYYSEGFDLVAQDSHTYRSVLENLILSVNPRVWASSTSQVLSINSQYSSSIAEAQSFVEAGTNRVLCSDTQVREMIPCFVGVEVEYLGNLEPALVSSKLKDLIQNTINTSSSLNKGDLIHYLYTIGCTRVGTSISLYVCLEDLNREIHRREIEDILEASTVYNIEGTSRLISINSAPVEGNILGASIKATKLTTSNTIGNGGT